MLNKSWYLYIDRKGECTNIVFKLQTLNICQFLILIRGPLHPTSPTQKSKFKLIRFSRRKKKKSNKVEKNLKRGQGEFLTKIDAPSQKEPRQLSHLICFLTCQSLSNQFPNMSVSLQPGKVLTFFFIKNEPFLPLTSNHWSCF